MTPPPQASTLPPMPDVTPMRDLCFVAMPFGLTMGDVGDVAGHRAIARAVLEEAYRDHAAGSVVPMPFRWEGDDLRERVPEVTQVVAVT